MLCSQRVKQREIFNSKDKYALKNLQLMQEVGMTPLFHKETKSGKQKYKKLQVIQLQSTQTNINTRSLLTSR